MLEYSYLIARVDSIGILGKNKVRSNDGKASRDNETRLINIRKYIYCIWSFIFLNINSLRHVGSNFLSISFSSIDSIKWFCNYGWRIIFYFFKSSKCVINSSNSFSISYFVSKILRLGKILLKISRIIEFFIPLAFYIIRCYVID